MLVSSVGRIAAIGARHGRRLHPVSLRANVASAAVARSALLPAAVWHAQAAYHASPGVSAGARASDYCVTDVLPPPAFENPGASHITAQINRLASRVQHDMVASGDLTHQRALLGLGALLKRPLPVTTLAHDSEGAPALATALLPFVGSYSSYGYAFWATQHRGDHHPIVVSITDVKGGGKRRVAYVDSLNTNLVIFGRLLDGRRNFTPAWQTWLKLVRHWRSAKPLLPAQEQEQVTGAAEAAIRLLAASHVLVVARVLPLAVPASDAAAVREAALRCLDNDSGDVAVGDVFLAQLSSLLTVKQMVTRDTGEQVGVCMLDANAVNDVCKRASELLDCVKPLEAAVSFWWNDTQALVGLRAVWTQDAYDGLVRASMGMRDDFWWLQTLAGTRYDNRFLPQLTSPHQPLPSIAVDDMLSTLRHYVDVDDSTAEELRPYLQPLVGRRPAFFFDECLPALWRMLHEERPKDASALQRVLVAAMKLGTATAHARMTALVSAMCAAPRAAAADGINMRALCEQLYASLRMFGGRADVGVKALQDAVDAGLIAVPVPTNDGGFQGMMRYYGADFRLDSEPLVATVLGEVGDASVVQASAPEDDPVFAFLAGQSYCGMINGYNAMQAAFTWHVLRSVLRASVHGRTGTSLADVLDGLTPAGFVMPARAAAELVVASTALCGDMAHSSSAAIDLDLQALCCDGAHHRVLYKMGHRQELVAFLTVDAADTGKPASAVMVAACGANNGPRCINEALRGASPAWQYTSVHHPPGKPIAPSAHRAAFTAIATAPATARRFARAFRVVLSTTPFSPELVARCNAQNATSSGAASPIILCEVRDGIFGKRMAAAARLCLNGGLSPDQRPHLAYLLPQTVDGVNSGKLNRAKVTAAMHPSVADELQAKMV